MVAQTWQNAIAGAALGALLSIAGCDSTQQRRSDTSGPSGRYSEPVRPGEPAPQARPASGAGSKYRPALPAGYAATSLAFPTGDPETSALLVHELMPVQVRAGEQYDYEIHVTNLTEAVLQSVMVSISSTLNAPIAGAAPALTKAQDGSMQWFVGDLGPRKTQVVKVTAKPEKTGASGNCVTASYNNSLCATTQIVEPALALTKTATAEALLCEPIVLRYEVRNVGTGWAEDVRVIDTLPAGLTTVDGRTGIDADAGMLKAGESRVLTVNVKAARTGRFESAAKVTGAGGLSAEAPATATVVRQPVLAISCVGADRTFIGRSTDFEITVKNTGDGPANDTIVTVPAPPGARLLRTTEGGIASSGNVSWRLGTLPPGESRTVLASFSADEATTIRVSTGAQAVCAPAVHTSCQTVVVGIPALLLEGADDPDPVQLGDTTTYTLTVTNQGTAPLTNVKLVCTLEPDSMEYVSDAGASDAVVNGPSIVFAPIAQLEPKARATYRVVIRARKEGQVQFKGEASSDEITRALIKTETTNFYK